MSTDPYRQTRSPEETSKKTRQDACEIKQRMTPHWDMDQLSREELETEMAKGFGQQETRPVSRTAPSATGDEDAGEAENPLRIGVTLLLVSLGLMAGAVLLLQAGGS